MEGSLAASASSFACCALISSCFRLILATSSALLTEGLVNVERLGPVLEGVEPKVMFGVMVRDCGVSACHMK